MTDTGSHQTDIINQYHAENATLRAEVERLKAWPQGEYVAERDRYKAQVEALEKERDELKHRCGEWSEKWTEAGFAILEAESESTRLKAEIAATECAAEMHCADAVKLDSELTRLREREKAKDEALRMGRVLVDDWINTFAPEFCNEGRVAEARKRIKDAGGTLAYLSEAGAVFAAALSAEPEGGKR